MADKRIRILASDGTWVVKTLKDMGDGTFAEVLAASVSATLGSTEITNDVGNPIPVAGSAVVGAVPTSPPLSVSGVDPGGLKRHLLTDTDGKSVISVGVLAQPTATIAIGATVSSAISLGTARLAGVLFPSDWVAADLTVQVSLDGSNYFDMYDINGIKYTIKGLASRYVMVPLADFMGFSTFKFVSTATQTSTQKTLTLRTVA